MIGGGELARQTLVLPVRPPAARALGATNRAPSTHVADASTIFVAFEYKTNEIEDVRFLEQNCENVRTVVRQ
jgi:hypothetical protein